MGKEIFKPISESTEETKTEAKEIADNSARQVDCIFVSDGVYRYVYSDTKEPVV